MATNLYMEARGESTAGMTAVAFVTYNRMKSKNYPNTVCKVVNQHAQFSWTLDKNLKVKDWKTWHKMRDFAYNFLHVTIHHDKDITNGSTFYHAEYVRPRWARGFERTVTIGKHIFYRNGTV